MNIKAIEKEYAKATEWNLATLEEMALIKSTSERRLERQSKICAMMLDVCATFDGDAIGNGRAKRLLQDMARGETSTHAVERMAKNVRDVAKR